MILKTRLRAIATLACVTAAFFVCAIGCADTPDDQGVERPEPAVTLAVPAVSLSDDGVASWQAVENASGYAYKISGGEEQATAALSVTLEDGQSICVKAKGDGVKFEDSEYSASVTYTAPEPPPQFVEYTGSTEPNATVTVTTSGNSYEVTATDGEFAVSVPVGETLLSITANKPGYFGATVAAVDGQTDYDIPLTGSVTDVAPGMEMSGDSFATLALSYYGETKDGACFTFTDPLKEGRAVGFTLRTFGADKDRLADGAAAGGAPIASGADGLSDADRFVEFGIGSTASKIFSDGSTTGIRKVAAVPYLTMATALSQKDDAVDFAVAATEGGTRLFCKPHGAEKYTYIGSNSATSGVLTFKVGGARAFIQNLEVCEFAFWDVTDEFLAAAITDTQFVPVASATKRNADGTISAVIGNGSSSGYLYDKSRSFDLGKGTLTLKTKVYSYGGLWQFHGFYIVDSANTGKHYNIGITQGNNIWVSWSNSDRDYNGYPGRVAVSGTSVAGTFGSYNSHGGWRNSNTNAMFEAELKLTLNGNIADLYLDGKRLMRADIYELFDKNTTMGDKKTGAESTVNLPGDNVYVGLYAFSDPSKYRTMFDGFSAEYEGIADMERVKGDSGWKSQVYAFGTPLDRNFILKGEMDITNADYNARSAFRFGEKEVGLSATGGGKISLSYGKSGELTPTGNENDVFDCGGSVKVKFELVVTDSRAALIVDDVVRAVVNGIGEKDVFEFYAQGANVALTKMSVLLSTDDGYTARLAQFEDILDSNADGEIVCVASTKRAKPVVVISDSGEVRATQADGAELVYALDGGEFEPYTEGTQKRRSRQARPITLLLPLFLLWL